MGAGTVGAGPPRPNQGAETAPLPRSAAASEANPGGVAERAEGLGPKLARWFRAQGIDWHEAEDQAQELLLRCWLAERGGRTITWGYFWRAAPTVLIDYRRRRRARVPFVSLESLHERHGDRLWKT